MSPFANKKTALMGGWRCLQCTVLPLIAKVPTPALPGSGVSVISTERHSDAEGDFSAQFFRAPDCESVVQVPVRSPQAQSGLLYLTTTQKSSRKAAGVRAISSNFVDQIPLKSWPEQSANKWKSLSGCWIASRSRRGTGRQSSKSFKFPVYVPPFEYFSVSDPDLEGNSEAFQCFDPI